MNGRMKGPRELEGSSFRPHRKQALLPLGCKGTEHVTCERRPSWKHTWAAQGLSHAVGDGSIT